MSQTLRWTSADLELMPDDGKRYEIIEGELYVAKQPDLEHQMTCGEIYAALKQWSAMSRAGSVIFAPGVIFATDDNVIPDVVWISHQRLASARRNDGHLHAAPEIVIEVLSPGPDNERRDRETKLKLYSQRGVHEYWIIDWRARKIEVYRREDAALHLVATLFEQDTLDSPLLPGFNCPLEPLFAQIPAE